MQRKTVTIVFADVVGSTSLVERMEAESARRVLDRFFDVMSGVVEHHGGVVEKFIGDSVMAVFGTPVVHEDDAHRAVRSVLEMRAALEQLNGELQTTLGTTIEMRIGVETGEVVADDPARGHAFVTGDAVNVAARLETAAQPGETLIGASTYRLVRHAVEVEPLGQLSLRGKAEPMDVYRLLGMDVHARSRRTTSGFVGRQDELATLTHALGAVSRDGTSKLVTVIGTAGVGKSRLVQEFLDVHLNDVTMIRGRCLPYGEGITYWPLKEAIGDAAALRGDESVDEARARIRALVESASDAELITDRLTETIGLAEATPEHGGSVWAARRAFEELARNRPLIVVIDDIQWAESAFLDLIEDVVGSTVESPILILCMARPELLDTRLSWASRSERVEHVFLQPLDEDESGDLLTALLDGGELDVRARTQIVEASDGLPLFVEEMVAMLVEERVLVRENGRWIANDLSRVAAPPTIHALLAARLDQLGVDQRALLQRASVEGQVFHRGVVVHLSPGAERGGIDDLLAALVLSELIEPASAEFSDDDAYRFHHLLLRDVAYESVQKDERASLHERFAEWLDTQAADRASEYDEIVGYHLERAYRYEAELRPTAVDGQLATRAGERLGAAGARALARGDWFAAASLLARTVELVPGDTAAQAKLAEVKLELAPATPGFLGVLRCLVRVPPGHAWQIRERTGAIVLRCKRCGKEKRRFGEPSEFVDSVPKAGSGA